MSVDGWVCQWVGMSVDEWVCQWVGVSVMGGCVSGWVCQWVGVSVGGCVSGWVCQWVWLPLDSLSLASSIKYSCNHSSASEKSKI